MNSDGLVRVVLAGVCTRSTRVAWDGSLGAAWPGTASEGLAVIPDQHHHQLDTYLIKICEAK